MATMNASPSRDRFQRAAQACGKCKRAKRRCDKALPACNLCSRLRKECDYSEDTAGYPNADDFAVLRDKVGELEAKLEISLASNTQLPTPDGSNLQDIPSLHASSAPQANTFPAGFFLDAEVYGSGPIPKPFVKVPHELWGLLGTTSEIHSVAETFFATIHTWLPIISKTRLSLNLANPNLEPTADFALLLLSMQLLIMKPVIHGGSVRNDLYWKVKNSASSVESNGLLSLQLLQTNVLLSAYEIGHAIFPAAYLTTGHAARLGHALGIHNRRDAPQMLQKSGAWAQTEEGGRTWWAVMLLDRYITLGSFGHPLATEDRSRTDLLPANDNSWNIGEMTSSEPLYVSSATSLPASWFQRTCQATHILGRYIRHRDDKLLEPKDRFSEAGQLLRTMSALTALLLEEVEKRPEQYATPIALCYSAVIHLCDPYACIEMNYAERTVEEVDMQTVAIAGLKQSAVDICRLSQHIRAAMFRSIDATSPLTADALYQAAAAYAWLVHETGDLANIRAYWQVTDVLKAMETRWACATEYLELLEKTKRELYGDDQKLALHMSD